MKTKQIVLKWITDLKNQIISQKSMISRNSSREDVLAQVEKIEAKIQEIEGFINREEDTF